MKRIINFFTLLILVTVLCACEITYPDSSDANDVGTSSETLNSNINDPSSIINTSSDSSKVENNSSSDNTSELESNDNNSSETESIDHNSINESIEINDTSEHNDNESSSSGTTTATKYQIVLNEYSKKLKDATPTLIAEFKSEASKNTNGMIGLATISNNKISKLAEISTEGIQKMANIMLTSGSGNYNDYEEWAGKLTNVYTDEAAKISDEYLKIATN